MGHVIVWTLKRGIVWPSEPVSQELDHTIQRYAVFASIERDPPLTRNQWWEEEARPYNYTMKRDIA